MCVCLTGGGVLVTPKNVTLCQVTISAHRALNDEQIDWT